MVETVGFGRHGRILDQTLLVNVRCLAVEKLVALERGERIGDVAAMVFSLIRESEVGENKVMGDDERENRVGFCAGFDGVVRCRKMLAIVVIEDAASDFAG